jgi:hypothetical protein
MARVGGGACPGGQRRRRWQCFAAILLLAVGSSNDDANAAVHDLADRWSRRRLGPVWAGFATTGEPQATACLERATRERRRIGGNSAGPDQRDQAPDELATCLAVVDPKHQVGADIRGWAWMKSAALDVIQVQFDVRAFAHR